MNPILHPSAAAPAPLAAAEILRARAQELARLPPPVPAAGTQLVVLEFCLAAEHYAVETRDVLAVVPLPELTPLPGTPPLVRGIVHARGRILPVLDLKQTFNLPDSGRSEPPAIVLVRRGDAEFGLLADRIVGVRILAAASLQAARPALAGLRRDILQGVTAERLIVLDLARLLADPQLVGPEEAAN